MTYPVQHPLFPPEVERFIFEYAAAYSLEDARRLLTVAKRVLGWIEPVIFRVLAFQEEGHWPPLKRFVNGPVVETFKKHGKHVQSLLIGESFPDDETVMKYVTSCPNLVDLGLWERERLSRGLLEKITKKKLKRLSMVLRWIIDDVDWEGPRGGDGTDRNDASGRDGLVRSTGDLTKNSGKRIDRYSRMCKKVDIVAWKRSLTHLELLDEIDSWNDWRCVFRGLTSLTHLSLPGACDGVMEVIDGVLVECMRLKVLVLAEPLSDDASSSSGDDQGAHNEGESVSAAGESGDTKADEIEGRPAKRESTALPEEETIPEKRSSPQMQKNLVDEGMLPKHRKLSYGGEDPRVVAIDCHFFVEWLRRAVGKRDLWAIAEEIVRKRQRELDENRAGDNSKDGKENYTSGASSPPR
ncbi:hypothetical protein BDN72DRAFT_220827 [Pluteus cervinus]|uniref:Uncharacterized protein n=1 Tax=Pluteus cervinus TaxID=181527 RepID=A0ACD3AGF6_9AGAR|nr:hypothetical protein BDN72DRAFT_220827 [Pluteus cervinus]